MRPKWLLSGKISDWSGRNAPPESTRYTHGRRFSSAICWARRCFFTVIGKYVPPLTVASLETMTAGRPWIVPTPVTMLAPGEAPSYISHAARVESSRNAVPGSISASTRSRAINLPRPACRARAFSPPPPCTIAVRARSSATCAAMAAAFSLNSGLSVRTRLSMRGVLSAAPRGRGSWCATTHRRRPSCRSRRVRRS